jgi:two-component system chemotaxis sensor kinase CheA
MDVSRYADLFHAEAEEHLAGSHRLLLELERAPCRAEALEELFRHVHTLKGMAAAMGYDSAAGMAHALEHLLDQLRRGALAVDAGVVDSLLGGLDGFQGAIAAPRGSSGPPAAGGAPSPAGAAEPEGKSTLVRVRQDRLDALADEVGELVIARERLRALVERHPDPELREAADEVAALVGLVRDRALELRRVPAGEVLGRLPRLVRDSARALGREVELTLEGRDEELDRSLVAELGDLLVHLLRNAVDHGIEPPEERRAAGKAAAGRIRVAVERERATVLIHVEDDGRGLDRERILRRARERGWLGEDADGADVDLASLIARPGFSTAERVTEVSGRGVGLDVVRARVEALGGDWGVRSEGGKGTAFLLRLPASLAIVKALQVEAAGELYSVPLACVAEVGELAAAEAGDDAVEWRGETLPALSLPALLARRPVTPPDPVPLLVLEASGTRLALLVDRLGGQHEAVPKPFDAAAGTVPIFGGATLRRDGRPSLVLDADRLARLLAGRRPDPDRSDPSTARADSYV